MSSSQEVGLNNSFYACRKCSSKLFSKEEILHESTEPQHEGVKDSSVSDRKASWINHTSSAPSCTSVFVTQPPNWFPSDVSSQHDGRMACPKCKARIGSFSWSGATCSCGRWITPAFQFQLARVDRRYSLSVEDVTPSTRTIQLSNTSK